MPSSNRSPEPPLRRLWKRLALVCLLAQPGSALAIISAAQEGGSLAPAATLSIGELPALALPSAGTGLFSPHSRARAPHSRYFPLAVDSRLAFADSRPARTGTQDGSATTRAAVKSQPAAGGRDPAAKSGSARAGMPLHTVKSTAPGQDGYVHFFLIEWPEGDTETQIGIELPDGRIAWSFPEIGVTVAPFILAGQVEANGRLYGVQHLYGLRPFPDEASMLALRKDLWRRLIPWVEGETPYCNPTARPDRMCLSCLGLALQVLFPGRTPAYPGLPADFPRTASALYYTTDDLLFYLSGLYLFPNREARLARLNELSLPDNLRHELVELAISIEADTPAAAAPRTVWEKIRSGFRSYSRVPPQRKRL